MPEFVGNPLAFIQGPDASPLYGRNMYENVGTAFIGAMKPKPLVLLNHFTVPDGILFSKCYKLHDTRCIACQLQVIVLRRKGTGTALPWPPARSRRRSAGPTFLTFGIVPRKSGQGNPVVSDSDHEPVRRKYRARTPRRFAVELESEKNQAVISMPGRRRGARRRGPQGRVPDRPD